MGRCEKAPRDIPRRLLMISVPNASLLAQVTHRERQLVRLRLVARRASVRVQLLRELRQGVLLRLPTEFLSGDERCTRRGNLVSGKTVVPLELIEVRARQRERWRPHQLRLILRV